MPPCPVRMPARSMTSRNSSGKSSSADLQRQRSALDDFPELFRARIFVVEEDELVGFIDRIPVARMARIPVEQQCGGVVRLLQVGGHLDALQEALDNGAALQRSKGKPRRPRQLQQLVVVNLRGTFRSGGIETARGVGIGKEGRQR